MRVTDLPAQPEFDEMADKGELASFVDALDSFFLRGEEAG